MLHLGRAIAVSVADGNHRAKRIAEVVLSLYIRAKIETGDVDTLGKMPASATPSNHRQNDIVNLLRTVKRRKTQQLAEGKLTNT